MTVTYQWRGEFTNREVNVLHAEAFGTRVFDESEWNWVELVHRHSLGWVVAREDPDLVGFVNVAWDGLVHAWLQDTWSRLRREATASAPSSWIAPGVAPKRRA